MRQEITSLLHAARDYFGNPKTASVVSNFVLASALASALPLPSSEVNDPKMYYAEQYARLIVQTADNAGRYALVSVQKIVSLTETLWLARYQGVFAPVRFGVLFGLPVSDMGDPDLSQAVSNGDLKAFLLKRDRFVSPACEMILMYMDGLRIQTPPVVEEVLEGVSDGGQ